MHNIIETKEKLDSQLDKALNLRDYFWLGHSKTFGKIFNIDIEKHSISIDIGDIDISIPLTKATKYLSENAFEIPVSARAAVMELKLLLNDISNLSYDIQVAEAAVKKLNAAGFNHASASKPSKALYHYYVGKTSLNKISQDMFNSIIEAGRFRPNDYVEFKDAYLSGFEAGLHAKEDAREVKREANRRCVNAIINSYPDDVNKLIEWLQKWAAGIVIKAAGEIDYEESEACAKARANSINSLQATLDELSMEGKIINNYVPEYSNGIFNGWELIFKKGYRDDMLPELTSWVYDKKTSTDMESYQLGNVYREDRNMLTGNPIIKDLVFNYGFKVGKYI